jgi:hypothetical protein
MAKKTEKAEKAEKTMEELQRESLEAQIAKDNAICKVFTKVEELVDEIKKLPESIGEMLDPDKLKDLVGGIKEAVGSGDPGDILSELDGAKTVLDEYIDGVKKRTAGFRKVAKDKAASSV